MLLRSILSPFAPALRRLPTLLASLPLALSLTIPATSLAAPANSRADEVLLDMQQAARKGDRKRLSALLPQVRGHALEPWAAYWELKARLEDTPPREIQDFLTRYAGTYQEDRLRNDWLLQLGQRRDWATFLEEYPRWRMGDDRELRCYAVVAEAQRNPTYLTAAVADEVRRNWLGQREADEGCALAAERLIEARLLKPADAWRKARQAAEANRPRAARRAVELASARASGRFDEAWNKPARFLAAQTSQTLHQELSLLAIIRMAQNDLDHAKGALDRMGFELTPEQRHWAWAVLGKQATLKLMPEAAEWFAQADRDMDLNDDLLGWKVRANLRATALPPLRLERLAHPPWRQVLHAINAMSDEGRRDPTWVYWKARALQQQPGTAQRAEAQGLLESIAGPRGFYEQLAAEALGRSIALPPAPAALTDAEREAARRNPTLQRALLAIEIGLRPEGVREWNYGTNLVNSRGEPGGMTERELLAAADYACEQQVWDRCINTSERTRTEFDAVQRYPMPFRDAVVQRAGQLGLDPAYVYGLIRQESRFIMNARSHVGASGLMQVMPATARWTAKKIGLTGFTADQINDRDTNIAIGTGYLKLVLDDFQGSMPMAAAAYNAGPGRPRAWRNGPVLDAAIWAENVPIAETRDYVKKVLANTTVYAAILSGQAQSLKARLGSVGPRDAASAAPNTDLP